MCKNFYLEQLKEKVMIYKNTVGIVSRFSEAIGSNRKYIDENLRAKLSYNKNEKTAQIWPELFKAYGYDF